MARLGVRLRDRDERGAIAVIVAITAVILLVMAAFAVDIGKTWAKRGELQVQADQAAVAGANGLPVVPTDSADKRRVARHVAHYLACNKVSGQTFNLPACNDALTPDSTSLNTAADAMLANGASGLAPGVRFPKTSSIEVLTPAADIDYTFGAVAGVSGVSEVKRATVQVSSPGQTLPIALSRYCGYPGTELSSDKLSEIRGQGDANLATLPTRVIALGWRNNAPTRNINSIPALPPFFYPDSRRVGSNMRFRITAPTLHLNSNTWEQGVAGTFWAGPDGGDTWGSIAAGDDVEYWRRSGTSWVLAGESNYAGLAGGGATTIPASVRNVPGSYWVTISSRYISGDWWIPASQAKQINIVGPNFPADAQTRLDMGTGQSGTCARYVDTPRADTGNTVVTGASLSDSTMIKNVLGGTDHRTATYNALGHTCGAGAVRDYTTHSDGSAADPNCLRIGSTNERSLEITRAWLGDPAGTIKGRLDCNANRYKVVSNCENGTFQLWGRSFNNDDLVDYYTSPRSLVADYRTMAQANYFSDGWSLISPAPTKLSSDIYYSPRMFWAPVVSTPADGIPSGSIDGAEYPVWTYRPVFITRQSPEVGSLQAGTVSNFWCINDTGAGNARDREYSEYRSGLDTGTGGDYTGVFLNGIVRGNQANDQLDLICNRNDPWQRPGFLEQDRRIKGLRFQTIEPVSMPQPPVDYDGPLTDYVGTGPRIVRLVK